MIRVRTKKFLLRPYELPAFPAMNGVPALGEKLDDAESSPADVVVVSITPDGEKRVDVPRLRVETRCIPVEF
jgi:hypothetical protein